MLPATLRDRYREQWAADLRDAADAGIPISQIGWGSLAFAATLNRSSLQSGEVRPAALESRARFASALALSAAVVMLSQFASVGTGGGLTGDSGYDFIVLFFGPLIVGLYSFFAPLVALGLVISSRGMHRDVRWAVALLVAATVAPLFGPVLSSGNGVVANIYLTPGTAPFALSALLIGIAVTLLGRRFGWWAARPATSPRRWFLATLGAVTIWASAAVGVWFALQIRSVVFTTSTAFLADVRESATEGIGEFIAVVDRDAAHSLVLIVIWGVVAAVLGAAVLLAGVTRRLSARRLVVLVALVLTVGAISFAGLTSYLQLTAFAGIGPSGPIVNQLLLLLGRLGLVSVVLFGVGGMRFTRRTPTAELAAA